VQGATIRFAGARARTDSRGRATIVKRFRRSGVHRARATRSGMRPASVTVVVAAAAPRPRFTG
jgi:hypothetical protein